MILHVLYKYHVRYCPLSEVWNVCVVRPTPIFRRLSVMVLKHTGITLHFVFRLVVMVGIKHGTFS